jgi:hypothetical protein
MGGRGNHVVHGMMGVTAQMPCWGVKERRIPGWKRQLLSHRGRNMAKLII